MDSTKKVLALFCITILLITTVTAGPIMRSEQRRLADAFAYLQEYGRKLLLYIIIKTK